jgi:hypothetical protein
LALPFFAVTLFVSAFLLFIVEPMIGKIILPRLGGTPQVWNTCMVFFQMALLAGYAYTHLVSSRLKLRWQLLLHSVLLLLPFLVLVVFNEPFNIASWVPPPGANPILATLGLLTAIVGLPFFVVATSAPLLQKWFASTGHPAAKDPYFLYGASNLGSLLALIAYPIFFEPYIHLRSVDLNTGATVLFSQPWVWTFGYVVLVGLVLGCVAMVWKAPPTVALAGAGHQEAAVEDAVRAEEVSKVPAAVTAGKSTAIKKGGKQPKRPQRPPIRKGPAPTVPLQEIKRLEDITPWRRLRWILLAAVPSSLMLGVTTYITTDLSPIPLLWIVPLALYLLSFILVFSRWPIVWTEQPHQVFLTLEVAAIIVLVMTLAIARANVGYVVIPIAISLLAFFCITMACHGELARDRPGTRHLTEYYLWMSFGGMLGGMFNGLVAPVLFTGQWEFPIALFVACLVRPVAKESGWLDNWVASLFVFEGSGPHSGRRQVAEPPSLALDLVLPIGVLILAALLAVGLRRPLAEWTGNAVKGMALALAVPLALTIVFYGRPLRFGLAIGAVLLVYHFADVQGEHIIYADRSYYGILRVIEGAVEINGAPQRFYQLRHGTTLHGQNFRRPEKKFWGDPDKDFSRLANTYYRRRGPAGIVMEKFNWFKGRENADFTKYAYCADARMPVSIIAYGGDPLSQMVNLWSEPPYAVIGLGTGTMASYARPWQHLDYYEIDNHIRRLNVEPLDPKEPGRPFFTYVHDAKARGAVVQILMGDARTKMAQPYEWGKGEEGGGPEHFYHMMVVDAFSSDAIPMHLLTKEAMEMYFKHLTEEGILCVHTSNRHLNLVLVVQDVAASLNETPEAKAKGYQYTAWRGHDDEKDQTAPHNPYGFSTSEWVMVARKAEYLEALKAPEGYVSSSGESYWTPLSGNPEGRYVWTDDYSNLLSVFRWH